uniref:Uncharacterized protein n=1 Tax=Desertifilum tharense IPPAS B-1220 TaxID=1781255 RepID=A0ACD5GPK4_9CYAN
MGVGEEEDGGMEKKGVGNWELGVGEEGSWELGVGGWGRRGWGDGEVGRWGEEGVEWVIEGEGWQDGGSDTVNCMLTLVICPGIHDRLLTEQFVEGLRLGEMPGLKVVTFPASGIGAVSSADISQFLWRQVGDPWRSSELLFISFSAGVVGAIGAAWAWQGFGGKVKAFIAIDGWGVPLVGFFRSIALATIILLTGVRRC